MPTFDFEFVVKEAFPITGRGVGVAGDLPSGDAMILHSDGVAIRVEMVSVELIRRNGLEQRALLLHRLSMADVQVGSVLRAM